MKPRRRRCRVLVHDASTHNQTNQLIYPYIRAKPNELPRHPPPQNCRTTAVGLYFFSPVLCYFSVHLLLLQLPLFCKTIIVVHHHDGHHNHSSSKHHPSYHILQWVAVYFLSSLDTPSFIIPVASIFYGERRTRIEEPANYPLWTIRPSVYTTSNDKYF